MEDNQILAITEVYYIVNNINSESKKKIPTDLWNLLEKNYDKKIYKKLNITNENIDNISDEGKLLLKIFSIYIK